MIRGSHSRIVVTALSGQAVESVEAEAESVTGGLIMETKRNGMTVLVVMAVTALAMLGCGAADKANVPSIDIGAAATSRPIARDPGGADDLPDGFCRKARAFCHDPKNVGSEWCVGVDRCGQ